MNIFDCSDCKSGHGQLNLNFFAPLVFASHQYGEVSVVCLYRRQPPMKSLMETIDSCKLKDICVPWTDYSFNQVNSTSEPLCLTLEKSLGIFVTVISPKLRSKQVLNYVKN